MNDESNYIIDACALIAYLKGEQGTVKVKAILEKCTESNDLIYLHNLNLYEVYYDYMRTENKEVADDVLKTIIALPFIRINIIDFDIMETAAFYKTNYKLSLSDSVLLGQAALFDATVITADHHEFDIIDKTEKIKFYWIR